MRGAAEPPRLSRFAMAAKEKNRLPSRIRARQNALPEKVREPIFVSCAAPKPASAKNYLPDPASGEFDALQAAPRLGLRAAVKKVALGAPFTGKELDEDTQLYYFGARYYDPRTSVWQSADPILDSYLDGKPNDGVFNSGNLGLYSYSYQNPIKYSDPDGRWVNIAIGAGIGAVIGAGVEGGRQVATGEFSAGRLAAAAGGGAVAGAVAGATMGISLVAEGGAIAAAGVAGVSSAAGGSATRALMGEEVTAGTVATDAAIGVATFGVLKGAGAGALSLQNPTSLRGADPKAVRELVPKDWIASPTKGAGGTRFADPARRGDQLRIMPGNPRDPNPVKQGPYARTSTSGVKSDPIPLKGNPTLSE